MHHKEIDPFGHDVVSACRDDLIEIAHFIRFQRWPAGHRSKANLRDHPIENDQLGTLFTPLTFAMHMQRLMLVGVEQDDQSELFVEFGHRSILLGSVAPQPTQGWAERFRSGFS
jgi:hypothetical protein